MAEWFPPGYETIADVFERTGATIFGAQWDPQVPTSKRLRTPQEDSEVGAQSMRVFEHLRNQFCLAELVAFILDPDFGPKVLESHWWFDFGRASGAFLEGCIYRPLEVPKGGIETTEYGYGIRAPRQSCAIGVRIVGDIRSPTARAETIAERWLTDALHERAFLKKSDYWQSAQVQFPRLSKRGFDRVWDRVTRRPEHLWIRRPGPKK